MPVALLAALALAALSAIFALQNSGVVSVQFLGWQWDASLALVLILTIGSGITIGYLAGLPSTFSKVGQLRKLRKRLAELEAELPTEALEAADSGIIDELADGAENRLDAS